MVVVSVQVQISKKRAGNPLFSVLYYSGKLFLLKVFLFGFAEKEADRR